MIWLAFGEGWVGSRALQRGEMPAVTAVGCTVTIFFLKFFSSPFSFPLHLLLLHLSPLPTPSPSQNPNLAGSQTPPPHWTDKLRWSGCCRGRSAATRVPPAQPPSSKAPVLELFPSLFLGTGVGKVKCPPHSCSLCTGLPRE